MVGFLMFILHFYPIFEKSVIHLMELFLKQP